MNHISYFAFLLVSVNFSIYSSAQRPEREIQLEKEAFSIKENPAFVIMPEKVDKTIPIPWLWFAPTIGTVPTECDTWYFEQFLKNGIAIAGINAGESYGSPKGTAIFNDFYEHLVSKRNFSGKPCLFVRSRRGL